MSNNKSNNKKVKYVPALLVYDKYGDELDYVIPKKVSEEFFKEQQKLRELWDDEPEQYDAAVEAFEKRWAKYKQEHCLRGFGKSKRTTIYIKE